MNSPSSFCHIEDYSYDQFDPFPDDFSLQQTQLQEHKVWFCQLTGWDGGKLYDEDLPKYIHYSIEWRVRIDNREMWKDTEQNPVLGPSSYWRLFLQPNLAKGSIEQNCNS